MWLYFGENYSFFTKNYRNKYEGWVLPKGTVEPGEDFKQTALREVHEETGVAAFHHQSTFGKSQYTFNTPQDTIERPYTGI